MLGQSVTLLNKCFHNATTRTTDAATRTTPKRLVWGPYNTFATTCGLSCLSPSPPAACPPAAPAAPAAPPQQNATTPEMLRPVEQHYVPVVAFML